MNLTTEIAVKNNKKNKIPPIFDRKLKKFCLRILEINSSLMHKLQTLSMVSHNHFLLQMKLHENKINLKIYFSLTQREIV